MEEQRPVLESRDYGKSEEATEVFLRKLDTADLELESQHGKVEALLKTGTDLEKSQHPNRYSHVDDVVEGFCKVLKIWYLILPIAAFF